MRLGRPPLPSTLAAHCTPLWLRPHPDQLDQKNLWWHLRISIFKKFPRRLSCEFGFIQIALEALEGSDSIRLSFFTSSL